MAVWNSFVKAKCPKISVHCYKIAFHGMGPVIDRYWHVIGHGWFGKKSKPLRSAASRAFLALADTYRYVSFQ
jgi:hypothetical protein